MNRYIMKILGIALIVGKMRKNRMRWFGYVMRKDNSEEMEINVE